MRSCRQCEVLDQTLKGVLDEARAVMAIDVDIEAVLINVKVERRDIDLRQVELIADPKRRKSNINREIHRA